MTPEEKRLAVAAYKRREAPAGVYVVRHTGSDRCWVGASPDLDAVWNRIAFMLRLNGHPCASLQAAWHASDGEATFGLEILEIFADEDPAYVRRRRLKERRAAWRDALGAEELV
ncbi:GIY-YIG nuclease family protein [Mangrovibrevibacter kandeliae]|uniref:GIY-YIG nuclease family protein n=1 Tax=Mangrovibrevibacter kandeliae TaxID=2968473 RepID=UPI002117B7E4|nr:MULTISPECIES: GIY-YIG nuclease family protein [unclassified Aurantimonas]MCQ8783447.1 GIY-YIG nuclease family protein [Aurantimonas sp. CSK15Z-1]MCW4116037.1 GIY-YIG nuclease family protein [Aurantimonas sp. MSK8Z-1]